MADLPSTYQGMLQYVAFAESQIKRNNLNNKRLNEAIEELKPKIKLIKEQIHEEN